MLEERKKEKAIQYPYKATIYVNNLNDIEYPKNPKTSIVYKQIGSN